MHSLGTVKVYTVYVMNLGPLDSNLKELARWPSLIARVASFFIKFFKNIYIDRRDVFYNLFTNHLFLLNIILLAAFYAHEFISIITFYVALFYIIVAYFST